MQVNLSLKKLLAIAFGLALVLLLANSKTSVSADSSNSHFTMMQGTYSVPNQTQVTTLFRLDAQTGEVFFMKQVQDQNRNTYYQWTRIVDPAR